MLSSNKPVKFDVARLTEHSSLKGGASSSADEWINPWSRRNLIVIGVIIIILITSFSLVFGLVKSTVTPTYTARANILNGSISGSVTFSQLQTGGPVTIVLNVIGIPLSSGWSNSTPTVHGFHIHNKSDLGSNCANAGPHFDVSGSPHGGPTDAIRHTGDLGNHATLLDGTISVTFTDNIISLNPSASTYIGSGRSFMIHADQDDLGKGGFTDSNTTGHAGARLAW